MRYRYASAGYRYKRYKKRRFRKRYIVLAVIIAVLIVLAVRLQSNVSGILYSISYATVRAEAEAAVNDAVAETLSWNGAAYEDLVTIVRDADGNVQSIEANAVHANLIARQAVTLTAVKLNERCAGGVQVPVGAFTGIEWLAGAGPRVTFRIIPVSRVSCAFRSVFEQAGVNQTLHSVSILLTATVSVVMPSSTEEIAASTRILLCEHVIVGSVPDAYLCGDLFGGIGA